MYSIRTVWALVVAAWAGATAQGAQMLLSTNIEMVTVPVLRVTVQSDTPLTNAQFVQIQYSDTIGDSNEWRVLANLLLTNSVYSFYDFASLGKLSRFYRIAGRALAEVTLSNLVQVYDGTARVVSATTTPPDLGVSVTYDGSTQPPTAAGTYEVVGTITNALYMGSVTNTLTVNKATATVTLGDLNQAYNGAARVVHATTAPSGLTVSLTYDGSAQAPSGVGSYEVIGQVEDANYSGSATNTLVVSKGAATVVLAGLNQTYDGTARIVTATTIPTGLAVSLTYAGSTEAPINAGQYAVTATVTDTNYTGSSSGMLVVNKAAATVTLAGLGQVYDGTAREVTAATTPVGLAVNVTYDGSAQAPTNAGSYSVVGTVVNANYAGSATNGLVVSKAAATVTLAGLNQVFDGTVRAVTPATIPASLPVSITYNGLAQAPTDAGTYVVGATINSVNYSGSTSGTLVVSKATAGLTLTGLNQVYDGTARITTATTVPSGIAVTFTYDGLAHAPTNAGSYVVVGTVVNANYTGSASGTLVVSKAVATVTFAGLSQTYNGSARTVTTTTTPSGLTVGVTYGGSAQAPTNAGSYEVVGTVTNANYSGTGTNTLVVSKATQSIAFEAIPDKRFGDPPFTLSATSSPSGLTVSFTSDNVAVATVSNTTVTITGVGTARITANQSGNSNYLAATAVTNSLTVRIPAGMALVPAGEFVMGDTVDGVQVPVHTNYVSGFLIDTNLVSYSLWSVVYRWATNHGYSFTTNAASAKATNHPVQSVSWYDAAKWCNARSEMEGLTPCYHTNASYTNGGQTALYRSGNFNLATNWVNWAANGYRLPTEAEWEKAARGGVAGQRFPWGNRISEKKANYKGNPTTYSWDDAPAGYNPTYSKDGVSPYTSPVGVFAAGGGTNQFGLCDMAGNVRQWCWDWYGSYSAAPGVNPKGPASGGQRVLRGGCWGLGPDMARCAARTSSSPSYKTTLTGFRTVRAQ